MGYYCTRVYFAFLVLLGLFISNATHAQTTTNCRWIGNVWTCTATDNSSSTNPVNQGEILKSGADSVGVYTPAQPVKHVEKVEKAKDLNGDKVVNSSPIIPVTGNAFLRLCNGDGKDISNCLSYFLGLDAGFVTGSYMTQIHRGESPRDEILCVPVASTLGQRLDIFKKFLTDNPAERHSETSYLYAIAITRTFPCELTKD